MSWLVTTIALFGAVVLTCFLLLLIGCLYVSCRDDAPGPDDRADHANQDDVDTLEDLGYLK